MNSNLTIVAFTIVGLGTLATFDVVPGAGLYAGLVMLAIGGAIVIGQLVEYVSRSRRGSSAVQGL